MIEDTRNRRAKYRGRNYWTMLDLVTYGGALLWYFALFGLIFWNVMALLPVFTTASIDEAARKTLMQCVRQGLMTRSIDSSCVETASSIASWALLSGLVTVWWNPTMTGPSVRVGGLGEYYKLQCILTLARVAAWYLVDRKAELDLDDTVVRAVHGISLMLNVIVGYYRLLFLSVLLILF